MVQTGYDVNPVRVRPRQRNWGEEEGEERAHAAVHEILNAQFAAEWNALTECGRRASGEKGTDAKTLDE
jgi:hypothetical protein